MNLQNLRMNRTTIDECKNEQKQRESENQREKKFEHENDKMKRNRKCESNKRKRNKYKNNKYNSLLRRKVFEKEKVKKNYDMILPKIKVGE